MAILNRKILSQVEVDNIDVETERLIKENKLSARKDRNYVDNKELYAEFVEYHKQCCLAEVYDLPQPPLSNKIGHAIIQICTRRCNCHLYSGYTNNWKEEMIGNAIAICAARVHNFNPIKYDNPFAYVTMIAENGIRETLNKEYREDYIKCKMFDSNRGYAASGDSQHNDDNTVQHMTEVDDMYRDRLDRISAYEDSQARKKERRMKNKSTGVNVHDFLKPA